MNNFKGKSVLLRSSATVFSFKDMALLWNRPASNALRVRANYYVKRGELVSLRRGLYAKDKNYNRLELASKIFLPSYVSFETVLMKTGICFQFYKQIFVASYLTRTIQIDKQDYAVKKIKDSVLTNPMGIINKDNLSIAGAERAFLDTLYLHKNCHFDNLMPLDWEKVFEMLPLYQNKRLDKNVRDLYKHFKEENHRDTESGAT